MTFPVEVRDGEDAIPPNKTGLFLASTDGGLGFSFDIPGAAGGPKNEPPVGAVAHLKWEGRRPRRPKLSPGVRSDTWFLLRFRSSMREMIRGKLTAVLTP